MKRVLIAAAAAAATTAAADRYEGGVRRSTRARVRADGTVRTPFGRVSAECVLELPSGTRVVALEDEAGVELHTAAGIQRLPPCAAARPASYDAYLAARARRRGGGAAGGHNSSSSSSPMVIGDYPPTWAGWPSHFWYGGSFAGFTRPPLEGHILSLDAAWRVPPRPANPAANTSAPWEDAAPTLSTWPGVQGGAVLQPVLEWNGLDEHIFDLASWNCCPSGYTLHSIPIPFLQPGELLLGSIAQGAQDDLVFTINSTVASTGASTTLIADMRGVSGWAPTWAEAIVESYFVATCDAFPGCGGAAPAASFESVSLTTTLAPAGLPVPWTVMYEVERDGSPGPPPCGGSVTPAGGASSDISVAFARCGAGP